MTKSNRHPIKWHSKKPDDNYHLMPNAITRDRDISDTAYRVLGILYSHIEGYEVSAKAIADDMGRGRDTIGKYLAELETARLLVFERRGDLVIRYHIKPNGQRFTDREVAQLQGETLPNTKAGTLPQSKASPCLEPRHVPALSEGMRPALNQGTKEEQVKDQVEEQREEQAEMPQPPLDAGACVMCRKELRWCEQKMGMEAGGYNGRAHKACVLAWLFQTPDGKEQVKALRTGTPEQQNQLEQFQADYRAFIKQGHIKDKEQKAKTA